jgi:hypothetical protein
MLRSFVPSNPYSNHLFVVRLSGRIAFLFRRKAGAATTAATGTAAGAHGAQRSSRPALFRLWLHFDRNRLADFDRFCRRARALQGLEIQLR